MQKYQTIKTGTPFNFNHYRRGMPRHHIEGNHIMSENKNNTPEFLNAEPEDMGAGLINMDTGERISWGDLEQPDEVITALAARKAAEESEKGAEE